MSGRDRRDERGGEELPNGSFPSAASAPATTSVGTAGTGRPSCSRRTFRKTRLDAVLQEKGTRSVELVHASAHARGRGRDGRRIDAEARERALPERLDVVREDERRAPTGGRARSLPPSRPRAARRPSPSSRGRGGRPVSRRRAACRRASGGSPRTPRPTGPAPSRCTRRRRPRRGRARRGRS